GYSFPTRRSSGVDRSELHDAGDGGGGQRVELSRGRQQQRGAGGDQRGGDADGEHGAGDHGAAGGPDGERGAGGGVHGGGERDGAAELSVAEEYGDGVGGHHGGDRSELHDAGDGGGGQRVEIGRASRRERGGGGGGGGG